MENIHLTNPQARRFILLKQGLAGEYRFTGKQGALDYIRQAGCIQYDPIDICGRNSELVLQSRVKGFTKQMLYELLYEDRKLFDYFDKNLAIMEMSDWPYFRRYREANRNSGRSFCEVNSVCEEIKEIIRKKGPVSSADIGFDDKVSWYWSDTKLSRAALETMYFRGDLAVHHKKGTIKYYDLAENCIPEKLLSAPEPFKNENEYINWRLLRRISAVGFLWNKPSDAWLNIGGIKTEERSKVFKQLLNERNVIEISVGGIKDKLYGRSSDKELLLSALQGSDQKDRCELIAPLDNMLWDRKLIKALFGFEYKWEIYTPLLQRKFGYYVIPILFRNGFAGRIEAVNDRKTKTLLVRNIWYEDGFEPIQVFKDLFDGCIKRFAVFNDCTCIQYSAGL